MVEQKRDRLAPQTSVIDEVSLGPVAKVRALKQPKVTIAFPPDAPRPHLVTTTPEGVPQINQVSVPVTVFDRAAERPPTTVARATEVVPQEVEPLTDEEVKALVARAITKDQEAFGALYDAYQKQVYRHIYYRVGNVHDAEDLTSQVFLNAWRAISRYKDKGLPFVAWLISIADNQVVDFYRAKKNPQSLDLPDGVAVPDGRGVDPEDVVMRQFEIEELRRATSQLNPDQQRVLILRFIEGLDHAAIAAIMSKKEGAVRVAMYRALNSLGEVLRGEQEEAPKQPEGMVLHAFADFVRIRGGDRLSERQKRVFITILRKHGALFNRKLGFLISEEAFREACEEGIQALGIADAVHGARSREGRIRANERKVVLRQQMPVQVFPDN